MSIINQSNTEKLIAMDITDSIIDNNVCSLNNAVQDISSNNTDGVVCVDNKKNCYHQASCEGCSTNNHKREVTGSVEVNNNVIGDSIETPAGLNKTLGKLVDIKLQSKSR